MSFTVEFYETADGTQPVKVFLEGLETKMQAKALRMISLLEMYGNDLREPYSKYLRDHIYELRISQGSDISRVLYFFYSGRTIVLTNGFMKKQQKAPEREIRKAIRYQKEYLSGKEKRDGK